jgi:hypothetical protein
LKYFTYHLAPLLAANYKQHILSTAKRRKVCYSLAEFYVISVYLNLVGLRDALSSLNILGGRGRKQWMFGNLKTSLSPREQLYYVA